MHMLFHSYLFIFLLLPLTLVCYYGLNHMNRPKAALSFLTVVSFIFYGYNNFFSLCILFISILINYGFVTVMRKASDSRKKRTVLWAALFLNICFLLYFKYSNFFIENINRAFGADIPLLRLLLPLGISFYTFQQISYVIDAYRGECGD